MRRYLLIVLPFLVALAMSTSTAQAVVVDMNPAVAGQSSVQFNPAARGHYFGVALVPTTRMAPNTTAGVLGGAGIPTVVSSGRCSDPALTPDLLLRPTGLCYHGGPVLPRNETFAMTWDPNRWYWSGTRNYLEQFLRDVADGSGTLTSPFAVTTQYTDSTGRAHNQSKYGGGCTDYGNPNHVSNHNTTCLFGSAVQTGPGYNYPANGCHPAGGSYTDAGLTGFTPNVVCVTDAQLRAELTTIVKQMGIIGRTQPGYRPMVVLPLPPGVETCLDAADKLCSANGTLTPTAPTVTTTTGQGDSVVPGTYQVEVTYATLSGESMPSVSESVTVTKPSSQITISSPAPAAGALGWYAYVTQPGKTFFARQQSTPSAIGSDFTLTAPPAPGAAPPVKAFFCSYHSQVNIDGTRVAYVVQPWTAMTQCDEPDAPTPPNNPPPATLSNDVGAQLVSPVSQAEIGAITDPQLDGWFALDGSEINDNGGADPNDDGACIPLNNGLDKVTVGNSGQNPYVLQREWNNGWSLEMDPFTYQGCAPVVILSPAFVLPSPIDQGRTVSFDGSATASTLVIPNGGYSWSFTGEGTTTTATGPSVVHTFAKSGFYKVTLTVTDRGDNVRSLTQTVEVLGPDGQPPSTGGGGGTGGGTGGGARKLHVRLQLLPQSLGAILGSGMLVRATSNESANGFATLSVSRRVARRAHIRMSGRSNSLVVIGRGTVNGIKNGAVNLRVRVSSSMARKLAHVKQLTLTLKMTLFAQGGGRTSVGATGRY